MEVQVKSISGQEIRFLDHRNHYFIRVISLEKDIERQKLEPTTYINYKEFSDITDGKTIDYSVSDIVKIKPDSIYSFNFRISSLRLFQIETFGVFLSMKYRLHLLYSNSYSQMNDISLWVGGIESNYLDIEIKKKEPGN